MFITDSHNLLQLKNDFNAVERWNKVAQIHWNHQPHLSVCKENMNKIVLAILDFLRHIDSYWFLR